MRLDGLQRLRVTGKNDNHLCVPNSHAPFGSFPLMRVSVQITGRLWLLTRSFELMIFASLSPSSVDEKQWKRRPSKMRPGAFDLCRRSRCAQGDGLLTRGAKSVARYGFGVRGIRRASRSAHSVVIFIMQGSIPPALTSREPRRRSKSTFRRVIILTVVRNIAVVHGSLRDNQKDED